MKAPRKSDTYTSDGARGVVKRVRSILDLLTPEAERVSAGAVLDEPRRLPAEHALPYARLTKRGRLKCPGGARVGDRFQWIEDIGNERRVMRVDIDEKTVIIDRHYSTDGFENGEAGRLVCLCNTEFLIPGGHVPEWV